MNVKTLTTAVITGALSLTLLTACGDSDETPTVETTTTTTSAAPTTTAAEPTETPEATAPAEPEPTAQPSGAAEPYIVDCQDSFGPIETYWSDGTVTGYSDYCQAVQDEVLQGEIDANADNYKLDPGYTPPTN